MEIYCLVGGGNEIVFWKALEHSLWIVLTAVLRWGCNVKFGVEESTSGNSSTRAFVLY